MQFSNEMGSHMFNITLAKFMSKESRLKNIPAFDRTVLFLLEGFFDLLFDLLTSTGSSFETDGLLRIA